MSSKESPTTILKVLGFPLAILWCLCAIVIALTSWILLGTTFEEVIEQEVPTQLLYLAATMSVGVGDIIWLLSKENKNGHFIPDNIYLTIWQYNCLAVTAALILKSMWQIWSDYYDKRWVK